MMAGETGVSFFYSPAVKHICCRIVNEHAGEWTLTTDTNPVCRILVTST